MKMQYLDKPLKLSPKSEYFSDNEIKEVKSIKAMKLQADPKNKKNYKRLIEHYNINLKSNDYIYKYYISAIRKSKNTLPTLQKNTLNLMITEEQIKLLSEVTFK